MASNDLNLFCLNLSCQCLLYTVHTVNSPYRLKLKSPYRLKLLLNRIAVRVTVPSHGKKLTFANKTDDESTRSAAAGAKAESKTFVISQDAGDSNRDHNLKS